MKLFGKKRLSVDEILAAIDDLSDEDKKRLEWTLGGADEPTEESSEEDAAQAEETEAPTDEPPEEPTAEGTEEPISEDDGEDAEATEPAEEPPVEEPAEEFAEEQPPEESKEKDDDTLDLLRSELTELKATVEALAARIDADAENKPSETEPFGLAADENGHETPEQSDLEKAKAKYWNF